MRLLIKCNYCHKDFLACYQTIKIHGAIAEIDCPHCKKHTIVNVSKFCEEQIGHIDDRLQKAILMIELSHKLSKILNKDYGN